MKVKKLEYFKLMIKLHYIKILKWYLRLKNNNFFWKTKI